MNPPLPRRRSRLRDRRRALARKITTDGALFHLRPEPRAQFSSFLIHDPSLPRRRRRLSIALTYSNSRDAHREFPYIALTSIYLMYFAFATVPAYFSCPRVDESIDSPASDSLSFSFIR
jgi:hypothetical protein